MNDMFEEAFAGFRDFNNGDADNDNEPKTEEVKNAAAAATE